MSDHQNWCICILGHSEPLPNLGNSGTLIPTDLLSQSSSTLLCTTTLLHLLLVIAIGNYISLLSAYLYCVEWPTYAIKWGPKCINLHMHLHHYDVYTSPPTIQPTFIHQQDTSKVILFPGHNLQSRHHTLEGEAKLASIIVNDWSTSACHWMSPRFVPIHLTWTMKPLIFCGFMWGRLSGMMDWGKKLRTCCKASHYWVVFSSMAYDIRLVSMT